MDEPATIAFEDDADAYVDWLTDLLFGSDTDSEEDENADADFPPNSWQGPINTGPVSFGQPIDDPVTSGSDGVTGNGPGETK